MEPFLDIFFLISITIRNFISVTILVSDKYYSENTPIYSKNKLIVLIVLQKI